MESLTSNPSHKCRKPSRRIILGVSFITSVVLFAILVFVNGYTLKHDTYLFSYVKPLLHVPSNSSIKLLHISDQFFVKNNSTHAEDLELIEVLKNRTTTKSNRYYLHDFEYFRMILEEFPRSTSATKLQCGTGIKPLLPMSLSPHDVLFIVMGSKAYAHKAILMVETWLQWSEGNFFIFADVANSSIPFVTLPQLENKPTRNDAQHRQLQGSRWILRNRSDLANRKKWFVFVDDDTWINVPALLSYLQLFDHRVPLSIGYIWDNIWVTGWSHYSGGGGIVYSQSAFFSIVPALYTSDCPFSGVNDVTLTFCQKRQGVLKIHSDRFHYDKVPRDATPNQLMPVNYVGKVTFHYMNNAEVVRRITCDIGVYWKWPTKNCDGIQREDMPHFTI